MEFPLTIIEPGIGQWRSAEIDSDEIPSDLRFHDDAACSLLDTICNARVTKVDSTLNMAFLDLGDGQTGVMNFRRARLLKKTQAKIITDCLNEGQMVRVQILAEPSALEDKALPVTPRPRVAGRYIVAEAGPARLNFSKDLTARRTKELKELIAPIVENVALIVRARAGAVPVDAVVAEAKRLISIFNQPESTLGLSHGWTPVEKALLSCPDGDSPIFIEGGSDFAATKKLANQCWPDLHARLQPYKGNERAFQTLGVEEAIEEALTAQIHLPSGGWISITPTPALTAVDVNMGGALKGMSAGEAKLTVNMEATLAIAHHLRFQDIGGIIVVDYINMSGKGSVRELMAMIEASFRDDVVPVQHTGISAFGLVEFTRKRSGLSLRDRMLSNPVSTERTPAIALDALRCAAQVGKTAVVGPLVIETSKPVEKWLKAHNHLLEALERKTNRNIILETKHAARANARVGD